MIKRTVGLLVAIIVALSGVCAFAEVYPTYSLQINANPVIKERINVVFDNSGHQNIKNMFNDVLKAAAVAENTDIWIYPIAGQNAPIKVVPGKGFIEKYYTQYSKTSNEFKPENVVETALNDLKADTAQTNKKLVLYADVKTREIRKEYSLYGGLAGYAKANPEIIFSGYKSTGHDVPVYDLVNSAPNGESMSGKDFYRTTLVKNGYSSAEFSYVQADGVVKIDKGKADHNILVFATKDSGSSYVIGSYNKAQDEPAELYISGCAMGEEAYKTYANKSKVKGVAQSYNHVIGEGSQFAMALFTADGAALNPITDNIYIPVINASKVEVYYRSEKGQGICGETVTYNTSQDKDIVNVYAPKEPETSSPSSSAKENISLSRFGREEESPVKENVFSKILSGIVSIIKGVFSIIFKLIRILIFVFVVAVIAVRKFRSYVHLKILDSKFGPAFEKLTIKIQMFIKDVAGAGVKIKGNADLRGDFIFISKASADMVLPNNRITLVVRELEKRGIQCWLSETGIKPGEDYNEILPRAIKGCTLMLLFVSPSSVKSQDVISEIGTAKEHKKNIIPVQIEPFDLFGQYSNWAYMLKQYQKTDLFSSKEEEIKLLADNVERMYNELANIKK